MKTDADIVPFGPYRRHLPGADFSLEANTPEMPQRGRYYLLKRGKVVLNTEDFGEAVRAYQNQCRQFWDERLKSPDPKERLSSAWGIVGLEPENRAAAEVIEETGGPAAIKRLQDIRRRKRAERWAAARRGAKAGA
jgi:hypothetical protein